MVVVRVVIAARTAPEAVQARLVDPEVGMVAVTVQVDGAAYLEQYQDVNLDFTNVHRGAPRLGHRPA